MNCPNCCSQFDSTSHIPRLLPHCGHTLCSVCVHSLISSNFIICTECQQLNMAFKQSDLPKNLAILKIQANRTVYIQPPNQAKNTDEKCTKHNKKLEAFCVECYEFVCLQCVLGHPKDHELKTMEEAMGFFREEAKKVIKFYRETKLNYKMQRVGLEKADVVSTINIHKTKIGKLFSEIRSYLEQKQSEAFNALRNIYDAEVTRIANQEKQLESLLGCYNKMVELSHTSSLKNCVQNFVQNKNLFNFNKQKSFYQGLMKKERLMPVTSPRGDLLLWDDFFNKLKEKIIKDMRNILDVKTELKEKPTAFYKNIANTANYASNKVNLNLARKQSAKHIKMDSTIDSKRQNKQNKQLHISLKDLDRFASNPRTTTNTSLISNSRIPQIKNPLIIYGGYSQEDTSHAVQIYNHSTHPIKCKFSNAIGHVKFGIAYVSGKIFVFGGKRGNKRLSEIYLIDLTKPQMREIGHLSTAKSGFGYCKKGNFCYIAGGNDGTILQDFQQYDFIHHQVKPLCRLTIARDQLTAVLHKNQIFAIGGYNLDSELSLSVVERYSFETRRWTVGAPLAMQRRSHGSISIESGLYVVGGYDGRNYLSTVEKYNQIENRWQIICEMAEQRCTFGISENVKADGFYVFGGFARQPLATCQAFSSETLRFSSAEPLQTKRFMLSAIQTSLEL